MPKVHEKSLDIINNVKKKGKLNGEEMDSMTEENLKPQVYI